MTEGYLMAGQRSELERLQLQARLWEPAGRAALQRLGDGRGPRALDVGCGGRGWLRILSDRVGNEGQVVGSDTSGGSCSACWPWSPSSRPT
jgi:ubiquinone/menaquinone biosynthesis C-methylase UbiE